jgi:hypothetical protein
LALVIILMLALVPSGCGRASRIQFIPDGGTYAADGLAEALADADPGRAAKVETSEAAEVRQDALANLRTHGAEAGKLADVLTSEFPTDTAAVPFRVEHGTYADKDAWIVFEAWGDAEGKLIHRRVWVFAYGDTTLVTALSSD